MNLMGLQEILLLLVIFAWLLSKIFERWRHFQIFKKLDIPGPKPSLFFGNIRELRWSGRSPLSVYDDWQAQYGRIYGYYGGSRPTLVIRDLDLIQQVLVKHSSEHFSTRLTPVVKAKPLMDTLVGVKGRRWKKLRRVLVPTFSASRMRNMFHAINRSLSTTKDILESDHGKDVDLLALFQGFSCEVICKCALAMSINCQRNQNDVFLKAVREFLKNVMSPLLLIAMCFPWFASFVQLLIDKFSISAKMTNIVCYNVQNVLEIRRNTGDKDKSHSRFFHGGTNPVTDVIQTMLDSTKNPRAAPGLTDEEIVANSWIFLLGGFETTSSALTFISYLLALNPHVQHKLFEELEASIPKEDELTYDTVNELSYLHQVICESLRIYPPVVTFIVRETEKETQVGHYTIPAGVSILVPVWQIQHDPLLWPNPSHFDPDRFSQDVRRNQHPMSWIPFGAGPRNCVGKRFALLTIKLALARLIRNFRLLPSERTSQTLNLMLSTVTISPDQPVYVKFKSRLQ